MKRFFGPALVLFAAFGGMIGCGGYVSAPQAAVQQPTVTIPTNGQWITGYYNSQNGIEPISAIPWMDYTHIIHFATAPGVDATGNATGGMDPSRLPQGEINELIAARPASKRVLVSVADNGAFPLAFGQATAPPLIATFVSNIAAFVNSNGYDGVDVDWERNVDVTQYENLISLLRTALPTKLITMAAGNYDSLQNVAAASYTFLDQINMECYDMDYVANQFSWYNDALLQAGNTTVPTCDWRAAAFTSLGVPAIKIGIGMPFFVHIWPGVTQALVQGNFTISPDTPMSAIMANPLLWQSANQFYDSTYKSNYLSIASLDEFIPYNGSQFITDMVAWQKSNGFGGFMTYTLHDEYLPAQAGNAAYPLSTFLCMQVFGTC